MVFGVLIGFYLWGGVESMGFGYSELQIIADRTIARVIEHSAKHADMCMNCPIILTRREYFFTKRHLQKMFNMKNASKLMYLYGVRILRDDRI